MDLAKLHAPFPPEKISWRLGSTNGEKTKGMALAYIDARDVMGRLDEVCEMLWQAEYVPMPNGTCCCRIGLKIGEEWVWRSNGSMNISDSDKADAKEMAEKGSYSDAFKRAAVLWGIGQYLYDLDSPWVEIEPAGRSFKIKADQYARLRACLGGKATAAAKPAPVEAKPAMTPKEFSTQCEGRIADIKTPDDAKRFRAANYAGLSKLDNSDPELFERVMKALHAKEGSFKMESA